MLDIDSDIKVVSFDVQGTLSDKSFGDYFWLETLPELYSNFYDIPLEESKEQLKDFFKKIGYYDLRFYSAHYWLNRLSVEKSFRDILDNSPVKPHQNHKAVALLNECANNGYKLIALSATHLEFIDIELDGVKEYFVNIYSCIDDFETAGKPASIYDKIVEKLEISSRELCNIGDNKEMDVDNARSAGCQAMLWPDDFITVSR